MRIQNQMSDDAVLAELGRRIARQRLDHDLTQPQLAAAAGVSRSTIVRLEAGQSVALSGLLRVLRTLGLLEGLEALVPEPLPSPLALLERAGRERQRASGSHRERGSEDSGGWRWGTQ
jgi:transcriptional regulator with XRE-family HTH domain